MTTAAKRNRWIIGAIIVIALVYLVYVWDRVVVGIELVEIRKDLGLSLKDAGLLATVFTFGITLAAIPAGLFVMRYGTRAALVTGAVLFSLCTAWTAVAPGLGTMIASRIGGGVGEAVYNVALLTFLGRMTTTRRGTAVGLPAMLFGVGLFLGPLIVTGLLGVTGNWRGPFFILAALGIVGAVAIWALMSSQMALPPSEAAARAPVTVKRITDILTPANLGLCFVVAIDGIALYSFIALYETYLRTAQHLPLASASLVMSVYGIGNLVGGSPAGYIGDRIDRRLYLLIAALITAIAGPAALFGGSVLVSAVFAFLFGLGTNSIYSNSIALIQERVGRVEIPLATGVLSAVYFFTGAFSGYILASAQGRFGWFGAGIAVYTIPFILVGLVLLWMMRQGPAPREV